MPRLAFPELSTEEANILDELYLSSLVSSVLRVCVRPYCALSSFRDDDVDVDDDECPSVAILAQETSVRFSPQALNTAFYAQ